jgi:hypothetical protein
VCDTLKMDTQSPTIPESQPAITSPSIPSQPPPVAPKSKLPIILFGIALLFLLAAGGYLLSKQPKKISQNITPSSTSSKIPSISSPMDQPAELINSIYERAQSLKSSDIIFDKNPRDYQGVWWISDDNYSILTPASSFLLFQSKAINNDYGDNTYASVLSKPGMQKFFDIAASEMTNQGFQKNARNSSSSLNDTKYFDYVQAYEKDNTKCTITVDPGASGLGGSKEIILYFSISVGCTDNFDASYAAQQPFLKALNLHDAIVSSVQKHEGDFYMVTINNRRTGHYTILKKEGDSYREIVSGQDIPPCDKMDENQVPKSIYGTCFDTKSGTPR